MTNVNVSLDAIRKRAEAATAGPWECAVVHDRTYIREYNDFTICETYVLNCEANTEFIAHAREDVPALLAEVERLKEKLEYISELSEDFYEQDYVDENGVIVMKVSDSLAHYRSTIQEIFVISSEEVGEDGEGME